MRVLIGVALIVLSSCRTKPSGKPDAGVSVAVSASAVASAAATNEGPGTPPPGKSFYVVAFGSNATLTRSGPLLVTGPKSVYDVRGDELVRRTELDPIPLDEISQVLASDSGELAIVGGRERDARPRSEAVNLLREKDGWRELRKPINRFLIWSGKELIALLIPEFDPANPISSKREWVDVAFGSAAKPWPAFATYTDDSRPRVSALGTDALASGEVYRAGRDLEASEEAVVESFKAGDEKTVIERLPRVKGDDPPDPLCVHARSAREVWVGGNTSANHAVPVHGYLARSNGKRWALVDTPEGAGGIDAITSAPDGTIWIFTNELWERTAPGKWKAHPVPKATDDDDDTLVDPQIRVLAHDDVWIALSWVTGDKAHTYIAHTRPGPGVLDLDRDRWISFAEVAARFKLPDERGTLTK